MARMESTMLTAGWDSPLNLARAEAVQRRDEGCVVPESLVRRLDRLDESGDGGDLEAIVAALAGLERDAAFPHVQPDELEAIRAERPPGPRRLPMTLSDDELLDRFHGAWTGRATGCALGKPVELLGMFGDGQRNGRACIKARLTARGQWPLNDFFSGVKVSDGDAALICPRSWRENIAFLEADDDIHYSLIALLVLERCGAAFSWTDIADAWNEHLPFASICTAETQAILNYNLCSARLRIARGLGAGCTREFTRRHNNPYREWIGAQIRADVWGYACAGDPERAAALAWRDASWTHSANGIYAAMMTAAMVAAAFVEPDPRRLVEIGLSEIPRHCRLAQAVRSALSWLDKCDDFEAFMDRHEQAFAAMHPTHAINNMLVVIMALHYGRGAVDPAITTAVMAGLDTDSNGATVGSVAGAIQGRLLQHGALQARLNDRIRPNLVGCEQLAMSDLAARTLAVHRVMRRQCLIADAP
jgi:hypothetical protein